MFTGIVEDVGSIRNVTARHRSSVLEITTGLPGIRPGDSICVGGACLTVVRVEPGAFVVEVSPETLSRTTLKKARPSRRVNLERALVVGGKVGGHFVTGHVDRVGVVCKKTPAAGFSVLEISCPPDVAGCIVSKGSIAVDGVSLTVAESRNRRFSVSVIPYTLRHTTLGDLRVGDEVNLEVDILARYVQGMVEKRGAGGRGFAW